MRANNTDRCEEPALVDVGEFEFLSSVICQAPLVLAELTVSKQIVLQDVQIIILRTSQRRGLLVHTYIVHHDHYFPVVSMILNDLIMRVTVGKHSENLLTSLLNNSVYIFVFLIVNTWICLTGILWIKPSYTILYAT